MNHQEIQTEKTPLQCKADTLREAAGDAMGSMFMTAGVKAQLAAVVDFATAVANELQDIRDELKLHRDAIQGPGKVGA